MNPVITFFRDTLDGTTYVIVCSVSAVLLCACIGYLAEKKSKNKNQKLEEDNQTTNNVSEESTVPMSQQATPEPLENYQETAYVTPSQEIMAGVESQPTVKEQPNNVNEMVDQTPQESYQQPQMPQAVENQQPQVPTMAVPQTDPVSSTIPQQQTPTTPQYQQPQMPQQSMDQFSQPQAPQQMPQAQSSEIFPAVNNQIPTAQIDTVATNMEAATLETPQVPEQIENLQSTEQPIENIETPQAPSTQIEQPQMPQAVENQQPQIPTIQ